MAEFELIEFRPWHMKLFKPGKYYDEPVTDPETRAYLYRRVHGLTVLLDGEIVGILGIAPVWPGVGELTMLPSDTLYRYPKMLIRTCKQLIDLAAFTLGLHRVQATCLASMPKHSRFLEACGLVREGFLRSYGPGREDMYMYSYIPTEGD